MPIKKQEQQTKRSIMGKCSTTYPMDTDKTPIMNNKSNTKSNNKNSNHKEYSKNSSQECEACVIL